MARRFVLPKLVVATHNRGKAGEIRAMLAPFRVEIASAADLGLPVGLATEFVAPSPQPPGELVQGVFVGEADSAVGLVGQFGGDARRLADAGLGNGDRHARVARFGRLDRGVRGRRGRRYLPGHGRQRLLHGLELGQGAAELLAVLHILHRHGENAFERTRHLH